MLLDSTHPTPPSSPLQRGKAIKHNALGLLLAEEETEPSSFGKEVIILEVKKKMAEWCNGLILKWHWSPEYMSNH